MKLVKFERTRGVVYVNPEHVVAVTDDPGNLGQSVIRLAQGREPALTFEVRGRPEEVVAALEGGDEPPRAVRQPRSYAHL